MRKCKSDVLAWIFLEGRDEAVAESSKWVSDRECVMVTECCGSAQLLYCVVCNQRLDSFVDHYSIVSE